MPTSSGLTLSENESTAIAMSLTKLNFEVALHAEKFFQLKNTIGEQNIFKCVCALLKMFSEATKVNKPLLNSEIILCSDWMIKKYTHDSLADIALALKEGIFGGHKFYGSVTIADVKAVIEKYFEMKAEKLENMEKTNQTSEAAFEMTEIDKIVQVYTPDYTEPQETFKEMFDRQKREKVGQEFREFQERLKHISLSPSQYVDFELINRSSNDNY